MKRLTSKRAISSYSPQRDSIRISTHSQLAEDIAAPDAFTANIRLAQLHSRQADNSENGTVLAIKVRDLELVEPDDAAKKI